MTQIGRSRRLGATVSMSTDEVAVGLISAPGTATEIASNLADDLRAELSVHLPTVQWRVPTVVDSLVHPHADDAALVAAARDRLLTEDWDSSSASPICCSRLTGDRWWLTRALHGVAVVCLPALGAIALRRRTP